VESGLGEGFIDICGDEGRVGVDRCSTGIGDNEVFSYVEMKQSGKSGSYV
jgi:hypothetical protein